MTVDELWDKVDAKMSSLDTKLDDIKITVRLHEQSLAQSKSELNAVEKKFNKEVEDIKKDVNTKNDSVTSRIGKVEKWMWFMLGAGGASGAAIAKIFGAGG